jgi:hypothetical protein
LALPPSMPVQLSSGDGYIDGEIFEQDRKEIDKAIVEARTAFRDAMGTRTRDRDWRSMVRLGPLADHLAAEARRADLILTGRPVLALATEASSLKLNHAIVAWKDTREARRAVADLPALGGVTRSLLGTSLRSVFFPH